MTRIKVVKKSSQFPDVVLSGAPQVTPVNSLNDVMAALGLGNANSMEQLQSLWMKSPQGRPSPPRLRKRQSASFLIVSPAPQGSIDFGKSRLESVWLDGHN